MDLPLNNFKRDLATGEVKYGVFVSSADPVTAEIAAVSGMDWLIIDTEHAPNDMRTLLVQLQSTHGYADVSVGVRVFEGEKTLLKRVLDLGALTVMVPMVESPEQATALVSYVRYPPAGIRGAASGRAARWTRVDDYFTQADEQICLIAQIETVEGVQKVSEIAAVEGIDALFVGPSDLAASMGHLGNASHPEVQAAVIGAIEAIVAAGVPAGVYAATPEAADRFIAAGATLLLVGVDVYVLAKGLAALADRFKHR